MISLLAFAMLGVGYDLSPNMNDYALIVDAPIMKPQAVVPVINLPVAQPVAQPVYQYYYTPQRVIRFGNGSQKMFFGSCASGSCR
jgi:hypothetical protein